MNRALFCGLIGLILTCAADSSAQEPSWSGPVFAQGAERARIEATPIEQRPYRPLHFYGNTVRRQYYRGNPLPNIGDFSDGARQLLRRR